MSVKEDNKEAIADAAGCLIAIAAVVAGSLLTGWAGMTLWGWFVVPLGLPAIGLWHALGLSLLVQLVTVKRPANRKGDDNDLRYHLGSLFYAVCLPLAALGMGWCANQLMIAWPPATS